jgi:hypothetical protein
MSVMPQSAALTDLIRRIDAAVEHQDHELICRDIKAALADVINHDHEFLDPVSSSRAATATRAACSTRIRPGVTACW